MLEESEKGQLGVGIVLGYRRGTNTQYVNQVLIKVISSNTRRVDNLIGAKVIVKDTRGNSYLGKVVKPHARGRNNIIIATFNKNLPGQTIGAEAHIYK